MVNTKTRNNRLAFLMKEAAIDYEIKDYFNLFRLQEIFDLILDGHKVKIDLSLVTPENLKTREK